MEFLERVVGENSGIDLLGDLKDERVSASDGPGGRSEQLAGEQCLFVFGPLGWVDAVRECRIDDHDEVFDGVLGEKCLHGFIELAEAWGGPTLCCEVRAINDHMGSDHGEKSLPFVPRCCGNRLNRCRAHRSASTLQDPVREARPTSWMACSPGPAERYLGLLGATSLRFEP